MITPGRPLAWLALMEPYDVGAEATVLERFATSTLSAFNAGPWGARGTIRGAIEEPFSIRATLLRSNTIAEHALPSVGDIVLLNRDGELDYLLEYSWPGRRVELRLGYADDTSMASFDGPAPLGVKWIGTAKQIRAPRKTEIVIPLRGIEDLFEIPLQQDRYDPGYEPYFRGDGVNNQIDFLNVLNRTTGSFTFGVPFRISGAPGADQAMYGKKNSLSPGAAGYNIALSATGVLNGRVSDGTDQVLTGSGGLNVVDGVRHTAVVAVNKGTNEQHLYVDRVLVDTQSIAAVGSLSNAVNLVAGATGSGSNFFSGELERLIQMNGAGAGVIDAVHDALDERYADDVDASSFGHYVPLTENLGTTAEDRSPNGFDGTFSGEAGDPDAYWSGLREGTRDLGGSPRPILYGHVDQARPVLVDPRKQIWQVHDRELTGSALDRSLFEGGNEIDQDTFTFGDIWTNAPLPGEWRFQTDADGSFVRTAIAGGPDNLQSELTFARREVNTSTSMEEAFSQLVAEHAEGRPEIAAAIEITGLSSAPEYKTGFYWRDEITIARAMDEILTTADYHWTVNGRFPFDTGEVDDPLVITCLQIRDVSAETPDVVITLDSTDTISGVARDGFEVASHVPHWQDLVLQYDKFDGWMPLSQSLQGADIELRRQLANEWRSLGPPVLVQPQAILDAYLEGESPTVQTGIRRATDAQTEGERRLVVYDRPRPIAQLERTAEEWGLWIGAVVQVNGTRFGTGAGPKYLLLGIEDRTNKGVAGTRMWLYGGFTP